LALRAVPPLAPRSAMPSVPAWPRTRPGRAPAQSPSASHRNSRSSPHDHDIFEEAVLARLDLAQPQQLKQREERGDRFGAAGPGEQLQKAHRLAGAAPATELLHPVADREGLALDDLFLRPAGDLLGKPLERPQQVAGRADIPLRA